MRGGRKAPNDKCMVLLFNCWGLKKGEKRSERKVEGEKRGPDWVVDLKDLEENGRKGHWGDRPAGDLKNRRKF